jgi:hypothetical protein
LLRRYVKKNNKEEILMSIYTEPRDARRRELDEIIRPTANSSWLGIILLLIGLALAAIYFYGESALTVDRTNTGSSTITHPAPSPNPRS